MASRRRRIAGAVVLADEQDDYRRGPGRPVLTGPCLAMYAVTGALHRNCPTCGATTHEFCRWPNGNLRIKPCTARTQEAEE
ncbi:hypothetical protein [Mycolicibacterium mucogenicum]|uniref:Uncharacterized protein n=1 Tax=Mycolicibacterium mucogenicum DSM 44124 TaxID=1226753 RepID=A0A8H2JHQ7_MYCMU|nr:hypothetical protein [Mycolicibacterium mucogenicum]KAB7755229.1 hypothetical protein MMUC44124_20800 [Mycolicibacterium mucogenicum DSM 44124]QPG68905.1 hypothetical protein C1S78_026390 [Mycolicibacterium mucogenicum DSM 44124]